MKKTLQKRGKIALCITAALIFIVIVGCGIYVNDYYRANEMALKAQEYTGYYFQPDYGAKVHMPYTLLCLLDKR